MGDKGGDEEQDEGELDGEEPRARVLEHMMHRAVGGNVQQPGGADREAEGVATRDEGEEVP